jgi:hypothetical protein
MPRDLTDTTVRTLFEFYPRPKPKEKCNGKARQAEHPRYLGR